jgi:hypothetical protein
MAVASRRPGVVTFIGVILYIIGAVDILAGLTFIVTSGNTTIQDQVGQGSTVLVWSGIVEIIIGAITIIVARGVMTGASWARLIVAIVQGLRMAGAVILMLVHHEGGYLASGLVTLFVGVFVIWALYGNEAADDYFTRLEGGDRGAAPPPAAA